MHREPGHLFTNAGLTLTSSSWDFVTVCPFFSSSSLVSSSVRSAKAASNLRSASSYNHGSCCDKCGGITRNKLVPVWMTAIHSQLRARFDSCTENTSLSKRITDHLLLSQRARMILTVHKRKASPAGFQSSAFSFPGHARSFHVPIFPPDSTERVKLVPLQWETRVRQHF